MSDEKETNFKALHDFRPMTDLGNGERMADTHGRTLRFAEDRKEWLAWRTPKWARGDMGPIFRAAAGIARNIADEAAQLDDAPRVDPVKGGLKPSDRTRMLAHATASESRKSQEAMISLAAHVSPISCAAKDFDASPWLLNTPNGIVDLRDSSTAPVHPEAMMSRAAVAEFHPLASSSIWETFLGQVTCGDSELQDWLHRAVGMTLIGFQREHVILFCFGSGGNGKGVFLNAILHAIGDYGMTLPPNALMERKFDPHPTEIADLEGKRMAVAEEVPRGAAWNESLLKQATGGGSMRAHKMRQDNVEFELSHTLWIEGNDKPRIRGTDKGIWRRMRLIPFLADIAPADVDQELPAKLANESAAILAWAIDGCREYLTRGLGMCEAVKLATDEYRRDEDMFGCFLEDCCIVAEESRVFKSTFREALRNWLIDREYRPMSDRAVKAELQRRGIVEHRDPYTSGWEWSGVNLLTLSTARAHMGT